MRLERGVGLGTKLHERGCNSSVFVSLVSWGSTGCELNEEIGLFSRE